MNDEEGALLQEAVWLLRIIARPQMVEFRERFESAMLGTAKRREMWEEMDDSRSIADIRRKVGVSHEAVRQFVSEVQARWPDAMKIRKSGNSVYPRRLL